VSEAGGLVEPLGELALDLLQFIDEGLTNQEITLPGRISP
jgi:hypothetical protein